MLRFTLFGFPVTIHWMFWLTSAMLGYGFARVPGREGLTMLLLWMAVVLVSVLVHELGHAFAFRRFGHRPQITLAAFGGYAQGTSMLTRREDILVSLAGPLYGLALFGALYFLKPYLVATTPGFGPSSWNFFLAMMLFVNLWWSLLNLLPILPMDGGRVFAAMMAHHPQRQKIVPMVGLIVAIAVAITGLMRQQLFLAVMFGMMAFANWQRMQGQRPSF